MGPHPLFQFNRRGQGSSSNVSDMKFICTYNIVYILLSTRYLTLCKHPGLRSDLLAFVQAFYSHPEGHWARKAKTDRTISNVEYQVASVRNVGLPGAQHPDTVRKPSIWSGSGSESITRTCKKCASTCIEDEIAWITSHRSFGGWMWPRESMLSEKPFAAASYPDGSVRVRRPSYIAPATAFMPTVIQKFHIASERNLLIQ